MPEAMTRFCPECGHIGAVTAAARDCCPDGSRARVIPQHIAEAHRALFKASLDALAGAEPVGHVVFRPRRSEPSVDWAANVSIKAGAALYTSPPQREALSIAVMREIARQAQIDFCFGKFDGHEAALIRLTEAAHGIGAKEDGT